MCIRDRQYVQAEEVVETPGVHGAEATFTWQGQPVKREFGKIGKSLTVSYTHLDVYKRQE